MKRKRLTRVEREKVYNRCNGHCAYCGIKMDFKEMQVDHEYPISRGGDDEIVNMLPACRSCNHRKSEETVDEFRKSVEKQLFCLERDSVTYKNAVRFGQIVPVPHKIIFYFERMCKLCAFWSETDSKTAMGWCGKLNIKSFGLTYSCDNSCEMGLGFVDSRACIPIERAVSKYMEAFDYVGREW